MSLNRLSPELLILLLEYTSSSSLHSLLSLSFTNRLLNNLYSHYKLQLIRTALENDFSKAFPGIPYKWPLALFLLHTAVSNSGLYHPSECGPYLTPNQVSSILKHTANDTYWPAHISPSRALLFAKRITHRVLQVQVIMMKGSDDYRQHCSQLSAIFANTILCYTRRCNRPRYNEGYGFEADHRFLIQDIGNRMGERTAISYGWIVLTRALAQLGFCPRRDLGSKLTWVVAPFWGVQFRRKVMGGVVGEDDLVWIRWACGRSEMSQLAKIEGFCSPARAMGYLIDEGMEMVNLRAIFEYMGKRQLHYTDQVV